MSKGTKTILIIIAIWVVILLGIVIIKNVSKNNKTAEVPEVAEENTVVEEEYVQTLADGSKLNKSEELKSEKKLGTLSIGNIQLREVGGITTLLADVVNPTNTESARKKVKVEILDKQGKVITELKGIIDPIEANGKVQLNMAVTADVANAYDFKISER